MQPTVIIAGLPADVDRRVQAALKERSLVHEAWQVIWMRSKSHVQGLAPAQLENAIESASNAGGAHILIFKGRDKEEENLVLMNVMPYFRVRWLEHTLPKLIPHRIDAFFEALRSVLDEELEWIETVKPRDTFSCLLLPQCAFTPEPSVRHLWTAAAEAGIERIKLAARVRESFGTAHWLPTKAGARAWIDNQGRVFDHRGPFHGVAPFPRSWKFSYRIPIGFHYDVNSRDSRKFQVMAFDGIRHSAAGTGHINIDPHGHVRL